MKWRILIKGAKPRSLLSDYNIFCEFPSWVSEDDAKAVWSGVKATFPRYSFLITNRDDWKQCYNHKGQP